MSGTQFSNVNNIQYNFDPKGPEKYDCYNIILIPKDQKNMTAQ